jgi:uncharacterized membrane protein
MNMPVHPMIVHFPIAFVFLLPFLIVAFAMMIRKHKMAPQGWLIIIGIQFAVVVSGYIALETGEVEEERVEGFVPKKLIHAHEEAGEIFVASTVIGLVLSIAAFFVRKEIGHPLKLSIALISVISSFLAYRTGELGGELVYKHDAGSSTYYGEPQGILPTPGMNTSESPFPVNEEENESMKVDEHDYGNADEVIESPDEDLKQED